LSEVVQFSIQMSQINVATDLSEVVDCITAFSAVFAELSMKLLLKSVRICRSYCMSTAKAAVLANPMLNEFML